MAQISASATFPSLLSLPWALAATRFILSSVVSFPEHWKRDSEYEHERGMVREDYEQENEQLAPA